MKRSRRRALVTWGLGLAALLALGVALWQREVDRPVTVADGPPSAEAPPSETAAPVARLFPGLEDQVNQAAEIAILSRDGQVTLLREGMYWVVAEAAGHPARFADVRQLLLDLTTLVSVEAKTDDPARHGAVGVGDPDQGGAGTVISVRDDTGKVLAALVLGNAGPGGTRFVRQRGADRVWLVGDLIAAPATVESWLERDLFSIAPERLRLVTIPQADGGELTIVRPDPTAAHFELLEVPEGRVAETVADLDAIANTLTDLKAEDARLAAGLPDPERSVYFITHDGLALTADLIPVDEADWVHWTAEPASPTPDLPAEGPYKAPVAVIEEIDRLNARHGAWAYRLPAPVLSVMTTSVAAVTVPADIAAPTEEGQ